MADSQTAPRRAVSPKQLIVVGVLAAVLIAVLVVQLRGSAEKIPPAESAADAAEKAAAGDPALAELVSVRPWPKMGRDEAARCDPFALPGALAKKILPPPPPKQAEPAKAAEKSQAAKAKKDAAEKALADMRRKGLNALLLDQRGAVAIIGTRRIRVGDTVEGFRVLSIDSKGVLMAPIPSSEASKKKSETNTEE